MNLKTLLTEFVTSISTPEISRRQLLEFVSGKADVAEVLEYIKKHFEASIISNGPTVYGTTLFDQCLQAAPEHIGSTTSVKAMIEIHAADGRGDPNQPDIIKTKSYRELEELIHPKYPMNIYISGETGLGKSTAVFGIAKKFDKPVIRVNLSAATDIDDLIGGIRIVDGNTVFDPGPVALAMEQGAILLLDEVDAGNPKILIDLHPVLEKKGVLAKKARKMIYPTKGFCVIATGNTKGVGDATGKYIGTNNMNHAFMERFGVAIEFKPPTKAEMKQIMVVALPDLTNSVCENLCRWYETVMESFEAAAVTEYIHPRKMLDIGTTCLILGAKLGTDTATKTAIRRGLSLKEEAVVEALVQLFDTIVIDIGQDNQADKPTITEPSRLDETSATIPF